MEPASSCIKCGEASTVKAHDTQRSPYCAECYVRMVRHRFRSTLGKKRVFKDGAPRETLVVFDGSSSSALQLEFLHDAMAEGPHQRLQILPTVLVLTRGTEDESIAIVNSSTMLKQRVLSQCKWVYVHEAACLFNADVVQSCEGLLGLDKLPLWNDFLSSISSPTACEELRILFVEAFMRRVCSSLSLPRIMLPYTSDYLSKQALSSLCLGRGGSVSESSAVVDRRSSVVVVRAFREICDAEVEQVNQLLNLSSLLLPLNREFAAQSVHGCNDSFVSTLLEDGFRGTMTTVLSTVSKIHSKRAGSQRCRLCLGDSDDLVPACHSCRDLLQEVGDAKTLDELLNML